MGLQTDDRAALVVHHAQTEYGLGPAQVATGGLISATCDRASALSLK